MTKMSLWLLGRSKVMDMVQRHLIHVGGGGCKRHGNGYKTKKISVVRFKSENSNSVLVETFVASEDALYLCCCYLAMNDRSVNTKMTSPSLSRNIPDLDSPIYPHALGYSEGGKYDNVGLPAA